MNPEKPPPPADANEEVSALIETLNETGQRLQELTADEVDAVADREARTFLLRRAQERLRHREAAKQAAILNALPANIALLDTQGCIISVNEAWRRFAGANAIQGPGVGIGLNYLEICDSAQGDNAFEAHPVANGIRSVLDGRTKSFSIEYPCHSPAEQRWFQMTVTPLADDQAHGVVVMHLNITERRHAAQAVLESEDRFRFLNDLTEATRTLADPEQIMAVMARMLGEHLHASRCAYADVANDGEQFTILHDYTDGCASTVGSYQLSLFGARAVATLNHGQTLIVRNVDTELSPADGADMFNAIGIKAIMTCPLVKPDGLRAMMAVHQSTPRDWTSGEVALVQEVVERCWATIERRTAEEKLHRSEALLGIAGRTARLGGWAVDLPDRITWSDEVCAIHDVPPGTMPGLEQAFSYYAPLSRETASKAFEACAQQGTPFDLELELITAKGRRIWARAIGEAQRNAAGAITRVQGAFQDITEHKGAQAALAQSEAGLHRAQLMAKLGHIITGTDGSVESWSQSLAQLLGVDDAHMPATTRDWLKIVHHDDRAMFRNRSIEAGKTGKRTEVEYRLRRADGAWIHLRQTTEPTAGQADAAGRMRWFNTIQDITEQKRDEIRIKRLNRVYAVLSGINTLIVRVRDRDELFREACRIAVDEGAFKMAWIGVIDPQTQDGKVVAWYGGEQGYVDKIRLTARDGTPDSDRPACRALRQSQPVICNDIATDPSVAMLRDELLRRGHKSIGCFPLTVTGRPEAVLALFAGDSDFFDDEEETRLLLELAGDISFALDHLEKEEKLSYLAYYDALTGLANRSLFLERLAQYMRSAVSDGHKLALYLIDLERFKNINDSLGRTAGDALLKQVAEWLTRNMGDANLLARFDADHFAVVLPEVKQEGDVARLLEKTMAAFLERPFHLNDAVFRIAAKVGVAVFPNDGADADTLIRNAEAALKKAKARGDRYLFYTQTMTDTVAGKLTLETQLRQALDKEEFVLHYQPKVNLANGKLTGAEALIRWNDPRTGLVPPGQFIPILEETGLIYDVGRWALRKAIEDYLRWCAAGLPAVPIAVNVSPLQLRHRGFIAELGQVVGADAQAAAGLELEITESVIMEDVKNSIATLQAIRAMDVRIAIDDFGTGFSSLSYLAKLPIDTLKIDRSFVIDMTAAPEGLALVATIINLAHSLKLKVVAEGVETEEQARLLRLLNCDEMQGYLFSKPVPREIFETRFLARPPSR
jgi:diguanylate cyclase (GGDEF)-like protein/PAS domain S-box-containing protein